MKAYIYTIVLLAFFSPTILSLHAEDIDTLVRDEMKAMYQNAQAELARAKKKDSDLKAMQDKALASAAKQAKMDDAGIDLMTNYNMLISSRYINDKGEFQPGSEITEKDQEYINRIFEKHLRSTPLRGRTSAGEAQRTLSWGIGRLQELQKTHSLPSEINNSELEIIAYQAATNAVVLKKATDRMADISAKLGQKIAADSASSTSATDSGNRTPSSASLSSSPSNK